jgi:hypothetical protein
VQNYHLGSTGKGAALTTGTTAPGLRWNRNLIPLLRVDRVSVATRRLVTGSGGQAPGGKVARWQGGKVARWQGGSGEVARWRGGEVARN